MVQMADSNSPTSGGLDSELPTPEPKRVAYSGLTFQPRQILAERYEILTKLGEGGMGEVWQAYDLKLRVNVALKSLRLENRANERVVEALRREVRTAREVVSPNVCRIFDLVVEEGQELISMEYIDGNTLNALLQSKGPLELREARDIASQFLAGLEAIHQAGLVHRDFKPENVMITRSGRVVLMDFGIAKHVTQLSGTISGTPPYIAPELLVGGKVDTRSDVFAAGVVLAEMIDPQGVHNQQSRVAIWTAIRKEPPLVAASPWQSVIRRAVAKNPEERYPTAQALSRALEEVTQRVETIQERRPYPGLAPFTEANSEYFFGRELEVETGIKKLQQLHLMALIGPSGAGKTSFLQAALIPALPEGWSHIFCQPGDAPLVNLSHALVPELSGDTDAMHKLVRLEDISIALRLLERWQTRHKDALLIVDRFEELFTLNPTQVQSHFAELLGRAPLEANVRVLLSMRDDFLFHCHHHADLAPIFSELTPLGPLSGPSLRRALLEPALKCGYRFEDEALVDEIINDVEKERGALPLMGFAASRLWEKRDRQAGLLTRAAYREIGGVAGALAQHAEATMESIGARRQDVVREIFRNLVTAHGTRCVRDKDELLSVFEDRRGAEEVLRLLIDARLITSYEAPQAEGEKAKSRVEIIHESLLSAWPRLVRWQTQDADSAQLRDQLRQAAQMWEERSRSEDLLWTGAPYKEFEAWRERYSGGLTTTEEAFAKAMTLHAGKRRRQRRMAVIAIFVVLLSILAVISNFWRSSEIARKKEEVARHDAVSQARRAEASKLLTLGRMELDNFPSAALAYAIASLELADSSEARRFVMEILWRGPTASVLPVETAKEMDLLRLNFSADGRWLAARSSQNTYIWPQDGSSPWIPPIAKNWGFARFGPGLDQLTTASPVEKEPLRIWSLKEKKLLRTIDSMTGFLLSRGNQILAVETLNPEWFRIRLLLDINSEPEIIAESRVGEQAANTWKRFDIDSDVRWQIRARDSSVYLAPLHDVQQERLIARLPRPVWSVRFDPIGRHFATLDEGGEIRVWSFHEGRLEQIRILNAPPPDKNNSIAWDRSGTKLALGNSKLGEIYVWDLTGPPDAEPMVLRQRGSELEGQSTMTGEVDFHPTNHWLAAAIYNRISFWPLSRRYPYFIHGHTDAVSALVFLNDHELLSGSYDGTVRIWSLSPEVQAKSRILLSIGGRIRRLAYDKSRNSLLCGGQGGIFLIPLAKGHGPHQLTTASSAGVAFSPDGKLAAGSPHYSYDDMFLRIWDLDSGKTIKSFPLRANNLAHDPQEGVAVTMRFTPSGRLITAGQGGVRLWNLENGSVEYLFRSEKWPGMQISEDARFMLVRESMEDPVFIDLKSHVSRQLIGYGKGSSYPLALDHTGTIVATGDTSGVVRVGSSGGEEPHLLPGHHGEVSSLAVSPDGSLIASGGQDGIIRLWPRPTGQPFHTLPYKEFLNRLRELTNIRVITDKKSSTGYRIDYAPFPGWEKVPTW